MLLKNMAAFLSVFGLLVDRSGGKVDFGIRTEALLHLDVPTFKEEDCPLCKEGKPFTKRGRTGK